MKVEVKDKSPIEKEVVIEVEPERYEKILDKVVKDVAREVTVPGFRKGKAPKQALIRRVGLNAIKRELLETLIPEVSVEALDEKDLMPLSTPTCTPFQDITLEEGKPVSFTLTFEVKPEFELTDYKGLELVRITRDIDVNEMVEKQIESLQEQMGTMVPVDEDRPVQAGDVAHVDFESFKEDGSTAPGGSAKDYYMTLEEGNFIPGFIDHIIGKKAGEEFEFTVKFPDDYPNKDMAGQNIRFSMKLHSIMKKDLPQRDDEFAKSAGNYETFEQLKQDIEKRINDSIAQQQKSEMQDQAITKIISQLDKVMIPNALIESHMKRFVENLQRQLEGMGTTLEQHLKEKNLSMQAFARSFFPQARNAAKAELIIDKIAQMEKIEATDEDIDKEIQTYADRLKQSVAVLKKIMEENRQLPVLSYEIRNRKVFDFLVDNAVITEKTAEQIQAELAAGKELEKAESASGEEASKKQEETTAGTPEETKEEAEV